MDAVAELPVFSPPSENPRLESLLKRLDVRIICNSVFGRIIESAKNRMDVASFPLAETMFCSVNTYPPYLRQNIFMDATVLKFGDKAGLFDYTPDAVKSEPNKSKLEYAREFTQATTSGLTELAKLCESDDPRLQDVNAFYGISRLAGKTAEGFGFSVFPIKSGMFKKMHTWGANMLQDIKNAENPQWDEQTSKLRDPQLVLISRKQLVDIYGKPSQNTPPFQQTAVPS